MDDDSDSLILSANLTLSNSMGFNDSNLSSNFTKTLPRENLRSVGELVIGALTFLVIIVMTVVGNVLVILAVFTYRPLKQVQNYFLVSLAAADLAVASLVMPFHVIKFFLGDWVFGLLVCQAWLTFDILTCTASILNLCAIALDRYWAITDPLEYAKKRTLKLMGSMIFAVWALSAVISIPPLIGWNDWSKEDLRSTCELTSEKAFVVFSACGSFYIPWLVMMTVYLKIFIAARQRIIKNRAKSGAAKLASVRSKRSCVSEEARAARGAPPPETAFVKDEVDDEANEDSQVVIPASVMSPIELMRATAVVTKQRENEIEPINAQPRTKSIRFRGTSDQTVDSHKDSTTSGPRTTMRRKVGSLFRRKEKISVSKEKKAAKTLAIIMGVFVLCWLPFFLMYIILPFCPSCSVHPKVMEAITWLGYINSSINPIIYTIFNMDFRRAFQKFLCPSKFRARRLR